MNIHEPQPLSIVYLYLANHKIIASNLYMFANKIYLTNYFYSLYFGDLFEYDINVS